MSRMIERLVTGLAWLATLATLAAIFLFIGFLVQRGGKTLGPELWFGNISPWAALTGRLPVGDGIWPAAAGTLCLIILASSIAVPLGVGCGIYLAQYASGAWKRLLSFTVDLLAGIPSILMGLFGFALILLLRQTLAPRANTGLLLSAGCLALLVLPYLIIMTQTTLEGLPETLKLTGPSLGFTPRQHILHVLLPAASRGILSGIILAVGRAAEDTAVILLTGVVANAGLPHSLADKFEALPFTIYFLAAEHRNPAELDRGFGTALVLLLLTSALYLGALRLHRAIERKWRHQDRMI
ncbi:MAG: ABC transporter permease subunit [Syntrophobacterales bacterium]|jgi:phosphate transport system permease protein|nr:ABC transporter permease subunit [Syntrophobacterales bacterium]